MPNGNENFLLGELSQFKRDIVKRLDTLEQKVDDLRMWKVRVIAISSVISSGFWFVISFLKDKLF